jgi:hypothetical protein
MDELQKEGNFVKKKTARPSWFQATVQKVFGQAAHFVRAKSKKCRAI